MKTLVFSDTHLTVKFNQKQYNKLVTLIDSVDRVIINGDFWEGLYISFEQFLKSEWSNLFHLLKSKEAVYIYGDHDNKKLSDNRVYKFCGVATNEYLLKTQNTNFYFTHGEKFLFPKQKKGKERWRKAQKIAFKVETITGRCIQLIVFTLFGPNFFPKIFNKMDVKTRLKITKKDNLLVCGHSHTPQYNKKLNFVDTGFFNYGWANYMIIEANGSFKLKQEKYCV